LLSLIEALFGDPDNGKALPNIGPSKVDTFCATGDLICADLPIVDPAHLDYSADAAAAAAFVKVYVTV
jgi:cutinase